MKIYVHNRDNHSLTNKLYSDFIEWIYFSDLSDLSIEDFNCSEIKYVFCVDNEQMREYLRENFLSIVVIDTEFLYIRLEQYHDKNAEIWKPLLKNDVVLFYNFPEMDLLTDLQLKVLFMGGSIALNFSSQDLIITHVIPYRTSKDLQEKYCSYPHSIKIYTSYWIEFFWNNGFNGKYNDFELSDECFRAKCFHNFRCHMLGFDDFAFEKIIKSISDNGGQYMQLGENIDCIIVPDSFDINDLPDEARRYVVVLESWWTQCCLDNCFHPFQDHILSLGDVKNKDIDSDELSFSQEVSLISPKPNTKDERKKFRVENLLDYIKEQVGMFQNFQKLKDYKITEKSENDKVFDFFHSIGMFFEILLNLLNPLFVECNHEIVDAYGNAKKYAIENDTCLGYEILDHYGNAKKYFVQYDSKINTIMGKLDKIERNNDAMRHHICEFLKKSNQSSLKQFAERPKQIMLRLELYLTEIIKDTRMTNPDYASLCTVFRLHKELTKYLDNNEGSFNEAQNQLLVLHCIGDEAVYNHSNPYKTVVDCMQIDNYDLRSPKSLFFFENSLTVAQFNFPQKPSNNYEAIMKKLENRKQSRPDYHQCSLSRCPSEISLMSIDMPSPLSLKNVSRNSSIKSETSSYSGGKKLDSRTCAKFHKLFTGMSELSWKSRPVKVYKRTEIIDKETILMIHSHWYDNTIQGQLYFSIQLLDKRILRFHLVPRGVNFSKYNEMKTAFPDQIEWEVDLNQKLKWDEFIVNQKREFCSLLADHYNVEFYQDLEPQNLLFNAGFNDAYANGSDNPFKTPIKSMHSTAKCKSVHKDSILKNTMRRVTKVFSKKSSNCKKSDLNLSLYQQEDESQAVSGYQSMISSNIPQSPVIMARRYNKRKSCSGDDANCEKNAKY